MKFITKIPFIDNPDDFDFSKLAVGQQFVVLQDGVYQYYSLSEPVDSDATYDDIQNQIKPVTPTEFNVIVKQYDADIKLLANEIVIYDNNIYRCLSDFTTTGDFTSDSSNLQLLRKPETDFQVIDARAGDVVYLNDVSSFSTQVQEFYPGANDVVISVDALTTPESWTFDDTAINFSNNTISMVTDNIYVTETESNDNISFNTVDIDISNMSKIALVTTVDKG